MQKYFRHYKQKLIFCLCVEIIVIIIYNHKMYNKGFLHEGDKMQNSVISIISGVGLHQTADLKGFRGFTLAEVLITLVIIGVIAAMTIPTLMNKTNNSELKAGFNKALSVSSQVIQKMKQQYGDIIYDYDNEDVATFKNKFKNYLTVSCDTNCTNSANYVNHANVSNDTHTGWFINKNQSFITQDGMAFYFMKGNPSKQMFISIDVNGPQKGPNRWGYDTFTFYIPFDNQILKPCSSTEPYGSCDNSSGSFNGLGCSAKAIAEKDYFEKL